MRTRTPRRCGFTLVELLVVIGIIALLISILLPSLARAREAGQRTKCLSNMRNIVTAFVMYTNVSKGQFPRPAGGGATKEDWIYWENTVARPVDDSRIAPYISQPFTPEIFRCPSDNVEGHRGVANSTRYDYSYSVNFNICKIVTQGKTLKLAQIRNSSSKILLVEEAADTIDDGCWAWQATNGNGKNVLSNRHDKREETIADLTKGRGNAAFVDGHAEFFQRSDSYDPLYWDPLKN